MGLLVTITGPHGCGKSTIMQNLATIIAKNGRTVGCMSCDMTYADVQMRFMGTVIDPECTIAKAFLNDDPATLFVEAKNVPGVYVTGIAYGADGTATVPPDSMNLQKRFFEALRASFDYMLVEASDYQMNSLALTAIDEADVLINVISMAATGIDYFKSNAEKLLKDIRQGRASMAVVYTPWHHIDKKDMREYAKAKMTASVIPHCADAAYGHQSGMPLALRQPQSLDRESIKYYKSIVRIGKKLAAYEERE